MIPFLDIKKINNRFKTQFESAFSDFLSSGQCILGTKLRQFEQEYATYINYCTCF